MCIRRWEWCGRGQGDEGRMRLSCYRESKWRRHGGLNLPGCLGNNKWVLGLSKAEDGVREVQEKAAQV